LLREGRALAALASNPDRAQPHLQSAEAALREAFECFQRTLSLDPGNIKALGNSGNALMARCRVLLASADNASSPVSGQEGDEEDGRRRVTLEGEQLLILAGRLYREVIQGDPSQARAFLNWGLAISLRAELARDRREYPAAHELFCNAAEKFEACLELENNGVQAVEMLRLAGSALMNAALCLGPEQMKEQRELLEEAESYLEASIEGGGAGAVDTLRECRQILGQ